MKIRKERLELKRSGLQHWKYPFIIEGIPSVEEVLELVRSDLESVEIQGYKVNVTSLRLQCFANKGTSCVSCGKEGTRFILESTSLKNPTFHLSLYCFNNDGTMTLMTRDHIVRKADGGEDTLENSQTMCTNCNCLKG